MALTEAQLHELYATGTKYRRELLAMPVAQLAPLLEHMTLRPGIRGKEVIGELDTDAELRPYRTAKDAADKTTIALRELETFHGDVVKEFDPHLLAATIYGDQVATRATETSIVKSIAMLMAKKASGNLGKHLFTAVRNASGDKTSDLFNGFCTIAARDKTAGKIASEKKNYADLGFINKANVCDRLQELYQDAACEELQSDTVKMFLPRSIYNLYNRAYQEYHGYVPYNREYSKTFLEGSDDKCELVPMFGMAGAGQIFLTDRANMLVGVDQMSDTESVRIRECDNPKVAQFFMHLYFGVEFETISPQRFLLGEFTTTEPQEPTA